MPVYRGEYHGGKYPKSMYRGPKKARKRNWWKTGRSAIGLASSALSTALYLKKLMNVEFFNHDNALALTPGVSFTTDRITGIAQSDDNTGRTGRSILAKSLILKGSVIQHASAATTIVRIVVLIDWRYDGATAVATSVFDTTNGLLVHCPRNVETKEAKRFKILYDKKFMLSDDRLRNVKCFRKLGHHIKFQGTGAADADALGGQIIVLTVSNEGSNTPTVNLNYRVRYIDN